MKKNEEINYYEKIKDWNFDMFEIETEDLTNWNLYEILKNVTNNNSKILDLGTGGGEKVLKHFPHVKEIIAGDLSKEMINTAKENLAKSGRTDVKFEIIDNLHLENLPKNYFDVVVARHTVTDPKQIYEVLKPNGYLLIRGVDKYDCHELKKIFGLGQAFNDITPISIIDYENVLDAKFRDVELVPIHEREYFKNEDLLYKFLLKVPILSDFSEEQGDVQDFIKKSLDKEKLDLYVSKNTYPKGIRLLRRYYGIIAKK